MRRAELTDDDFKRVEELRKLVKCNLSPYYDTDFNLLRWLQGHPGDIRNVATKLNAHLKARCPVFPVF